MTHPKEPKPQRREPPSNTWRKKYECKKLKGKHDWVPHTLTGYLEYTRKIGQSTAYGSWRVGTPPPVPIAEMTPSCQVNWRCSACNKHETEYLSANPKKTLFNWYKKKLDPYRQNYKKSL